MTSLTLNLASRPFRNNRAIATILVSVGGILLLATVANLYVFFTYRSSYAQLQNDQRVERTRLQALEGEERRLAKEIESRDFASLYRRGRFAGGAILQQDFSWTRLFNKLEALMPNEVMMTSIRPSVTGDGIVIRIDGRAKNQPAFLTLQERLLEDPSYTNVYPRSERKINPRRPDIDFTMDFDYLPESPSEREAVMAARQEESSPDSSPIGSTPEQRAAGKGEIAAAPPVEAQPQSIAEPAATTGTVGRDGRDRTAEVLARMMAAPGGVYLSGQPDVGGPAADVPGANPGPKKIEKPGAGTAAAAGSGATGTKSGAAQTKPGAVGAQPPAGDGGAVRLDVPLKFDGRTVREAYALLGVAHAVSFAIEPGVNGGSRVRTDLTGMPLQQAIVELGRAAGHSIVQRPDGVYRVAALTGEAILADRPIREEDLPKEGAP